MATAYPPQRSRPSKPISSDEALTHLHEYLNALPSNPYLLPNAKLDANGPSANANTSSVVIHNLQRVEAGLRGEWLAPVLKIAEGAEDGIGKSDGDMANFTSQEEAASGEEGKLAEEGWQDLQEYQREQSIEVGDLGQPEMAVDEVDLESAAPIEVKETKPVERRPVDKVARKKDKQARRKQEKREKAEKRLVS